MKKTKTTTNQGELFIENPRQKFLRLANARGARAIRAIRSLRHLANRRSYTYYVNDIETLCNTIADEVGKVRETFTSNKSDIVILEE